MTERQHPVSSPRRLLAWICVGHALSHFWVLTLPPLFPALADHFDVSYVQLGLLLTCYGLTNGVFQVPSGYLVDRYGAKPVLITGLLLNGLTFAIYGLATGYAMLLALALVAGVGRSVFHPANYSILSAAFAKGRAGKPYSIHTFSGFVGSAIAPMTIAGLYQAFDWQGAFAVSGLAGIALAIILSLRLEAPEPLSARARGTAHAETEGGRAIFLSQALLLMFIFYIFISMTSSGVQTFAPSSLAELYQVSLSTANIALSAYLSALAIGILLGGIVADRVSNHLQVVGAMFTGGMLLMVLLAAAHPPVWMLFPIFAAAGTLHGAIMPSRDKIVREVAPEGAVGKSFGFVSMGLSLGSAAAPLILGFLFDTGRPSHIFWAIAVFMLVAVLTTFASRYEVLRRSRDDTLKRLSS